MALSARSRVRARILNSWIPGRGVAPVVDGGGGLSISKLVYPQERIWLDTASGVITPARDWQTGAIYGARLYAQAGFGDPPVDAIAYSGGNIVTGAGWASVQPGRYRLELLDPVSGKRSHSDVSVYSDKPATYTAANNAELAARLTDVGGLITAQGTGFTGAIIDLDPAGTFGTLTLNQLPNVAYTRRVILRSAAPDRRAGARPTFNVIVGRNARRVGLQRLRFRNAPTPVGAFIDLQGSGNNLGSPFWWVDGCDFMGGSSVLDGLGGRVMNPNVPTDPDNLYDPFHPCFHLQNTGGSGSRLDLVNGATGAYLTGGAIGAWTNAPLAAPVFFGNNIPLGSAVPLTPEGVTVGSGFLAQVETVVLTDASPTAVSANTGATFTKPAGAPDGRYAITWRLQAGGSGYDFPARAQDRITWAGHYRYNDRSGLPVAIAIDRIWNAPSIAIANNSFVSVYTAAEFGVSGPTDAPWFQDNVIDGTPSDMVRMIYQRDTFPGIFIPSPDHAFRIGGNQFARVFTVQSLDFGNIHGDHIQALWSGSPGAGTGSVQPLIDVYGNFFFEFGAARGGAQTLFLSDHISNSAGFRVRTYCNVLGGRLSNGHVLFHSVSEDSWYDFVLQNHGSGTPNGATDQVAYPNRTVRRGGIAQAYRAAPLPATQQSLDLLTYSRFGTDTAIFDDPLYTFTLSKAELKRRFRTKGAAAGRGPFGDDAQRFDHLNGVFDPDTPFVPLFPHMIDQAVSTQVTGKPRQVLWRESASQVSALSNGGLWRVGATEAACLAATPVAGPISVPAKHFYAPVVTTSEFNTTTTVMTFTADGIPQEMRVRTIVGGNLGPPEPYAQPTLSSAVNVPGGATAQDPYQIIPAGTPVAVPDGGLLLVFFANDDDPVLFDPGDPDWQVATYMRENNVVDQGELRVLAYANRTGATVNKSLVVANGFAQHWNAVRYLFAPTAAGLVVDFLTAPPTFGATGVQDPPALDLDANREFTAIAAMICGNQRGITVTPTGFGNLLGQAGHAASSAAVSLWTARQQLTNNTINPSNFSTGSDSTTWAAATVAVFQRPA